MTNPTELVAPSEEMVATVSQDARDAAASLAIVPELADQLRSGRFDKHLYIETFAAFEAAIRGRVDG